jgi:hypothetical protein
MKLYVYDLEADTFSPVDCGNEHFPFNHMWDTTDPRLLAVEVGFRSKVDGFVLQTQCVNL